MHADAYFRLAHTEEKAGNDCTALLLYLSSLCSSFNSGDSLPYGTTAKIRKLQKQLAVSDRQLADCVRSYGALTDSDCRKLLFYSIDGDLGNIKAILSGHAGETEETV